MGGVGGVLGRLADAQLGLGPVKVGDDFPFRVGIDDARSAARDASRSPIVSLPNSLAVRRAPAPSFAPGGQSTQMIVGADASDDRTILQTSAGLYSAYRLRRV